jgi:hypothetical protein
MVELWHCPQCGAKKRFHKKGCKGVTLNPKPADAIIGEVPMLGRDTAKLMNDLPQVLGQEAEQCEHCGAKPGRGGVVLVHKKLCHLNPHFDKHMKELGRDGFSVGEPPDFKIDPQDPEELIEVIRSIAELPKVGDWYVLRFFVPMGFDIARNRKTYAFQVTMAQVQEIRQHGRDFKVLFDMETNYKEFNVQFDGDLFTRADVMAKALRDMADLVERGSA